MDDDPYSGWGLRSVEAADRGLMTPFFSCLAEPLSDYTFSQVFTWRNSLRILWTTLHGHLCVFANGAGDLTLLMPPIGDGDSPRAMAAAFELMDDYNAAHGVPERSRVEYASEELLARTGRDGMIVQPMGTDYVYDLSRMIDLAGGDLSSKRQAKNRFLRNYEHRVEPYDSTRHMDDCRLLLQNWKSRQDGQHWEETESSSLKRRKETVATDLALTCAAELQMRGLVVYVKSNDQWSLRGFTFGELLGRDQSSITIEKTDLEIKGLAQFIFSEFCSQCWADRPLVNVGDDWGMETLAWTKMSYRPVKLLQKYALRRIAAVKVAVPAAPVVTATEAQTPEAVTIRPAIKDDLAAAVELEKTCFSSYPLNKRQLQYLQQRRSAVFLVAEQNGHVVGEGIALVRHHPRGVSGRIYSLAVRPDRRGHKIGQRLLQAMIDELATRGVRRIYLEVEHHNVAAINLYDRAGFSHIGQLPDYFGPGKSARHMMCQVPAAAGLFDPPDVAHNTVVYNTTPCPTETSNPAPMPASTA
jgi:ribosomal protein S18 acetylase RimI-like enzyme